MVSHEEFRTGVSSLNPNIDRESIASLIDVMDKDGDGEISWTRMPSRTRTPLFFLPPPMRLRPRGQDRCGPALAAGAWRAGG